MIELPLKVISQSLDGNHERLSDCIGCGACTAHCLQSSDIPAIMAELVEAKK